MTHRYEFARAAREKGLLLLFPEGAFESLPFEVRLSAPWTGRFYGKVGDLKPADQQQLRHVGYIILREADMGGQSAVTASATRRMTVTQMFREAA
jgi:hypothetical protein